LYRQLNSAAIKLKEEDLEYNKKILTIYEMICKIPLIELLEQQEKQEKIYQLQSSMYIAKISDTSNNTYK